jgi:hypothetical protein
LFSDGGDGLLDVALELFIANGQAGAVQSFDELDGSGLEEWLVVGIWDRLKRTTANRTSEDK